jgi:uncharacterized protein YndB with AHSA1/START domain
MKKEQFHIEYIFEKAAKASLWNYVSTGSGLAEWFADEVSVEGKTYIFTWNRSQVEAEVIGITPGNFIRFHWLDDENPASFFEFRLHQIELTGGIMLEITDFSEVHEKVATINLWESQIKILKRMLGL